MIAPQRQNTQSVPLPAPKKGIVAQSLFGAESAIGPDAAIWLYNMIPGDFGLRLRKGSREIVTNIPDNDGPNGQIRSLLYFNTTDQGGATDKLFAVTSLGIFDVTALGAGPWTPLLTWPSPGGNAGWCSLVPYANVNGDNFLLIADEANGYYIYDGSTFSQGTFTGSTQPNASDLVHINEWNGRIWLVERDSATAWYLDPLALQGDITPVNVGNRFRKGGHLVQTATWSMDGGDGMDDKFVMVGSAGDLLVFEGTNPDSPADFRVVGRWDVGKVPEGRRVCSGWGGSLYVLSSIGIQDISVLLSGQGAFPERTAVTFNISRYIRDAMDQRIDEYGWELQLIPDEGIAVVTVPYSANVPEAEAFQFVVNAGNKAWCMWRGLDMVCGDQNNEGYIYGTRDGKIMRYEGYVDNVPLDGSSGDAIVFSLLTHYSDLGAPGSWKRPQFVRPNWVGQQQPSYQLKIKYDFDLQELLTSPAYTIANPSLWDSAIWDVSRWGGAAQTYQETLGVRGMGRHVAFAIRGTGTSELSLLGWTFMYDTGGLL